MTETDKDARPKADTEPDDSPFSTPAVEGMPFKRGSEEDAAIARILEWPDTAPSAA